MAFLSAFLKFISSFFRKKPKLIELNVDSVIDFLKAFQEKSMKEVLIKTNSLISEINFLLKEIELKLNELKEASIETDSGSTKLRSMASTSKKELELKLSILLKKLEVPKTNNLKEINDYALNASQTLTKEIILFRKNIIYTSVLLKNLMKDLGNLFEELNQKLNELLLLFKENSFVLVDLKALDLKLKEKKENIKLIEKEINELKEKLSTQKKLLDSMEAKLSKFSEMPEFLELQELEKQKTETEKELSLLEGKAIQLFSFIERPARKLLKAKPELISSELNEFIQKLFSKPLIAIKTDPKNAKLNELFSLVKENINEINLKSEKEVQKTLEKINALTKTDFFTEFFWLENELKKRLAEINKKMNSITFKREAISLNEEINKTKKEIALIENELNLFNSRKEKAVNDFNEFISLLEKDIEKNTNQKVKILFN